MAKLFTFLLVVTSFGGSIHAAPGSSQSVHPSLLSKLHSEGSTANIFVTMREYPTDLLTKIRRQNFVNREARLNAVAAFLQDFTADSQQSVIRFLNEKSFHFESFWVSNQIFIKDATRSLVEGLSQIDTIGEIAEELIIHLDEPLEVEESHNETRANQWGVTKIQADRVWASGNRGQGIVVGGIDSGVRRNHETLRGNYRSPYGWFDPGRPNANSSPSDNNGHGTHTMGTIVGANGIGVAPGAQWIACRGCTSSSCPQAHLTACGQFMTCPTLPDKSQPDCTKAPHVVNNSWGGGQGTTYYNRIIQAWRAAGIVPVFSQGNSGPSCGTANSPGDNGDVIGVGSTTSSDGLSSFSSVGPTAVGRRIKPDISAPGSNVYSAYHTSDTAYKTMSGTSMSGPHAAGAVALLLSAKGGTATYSEITQALYSGADTNVVKTGKNCGGVNENNFPNNAFGHGRLNVNRAVAALLSKNKQ